MTDSGLFDLVVVGSGISGCLAALGVQRKGQKVLILEASSRSGGQIYSTNFTGIATIFEKGAEFLDTRCHINLVELLRKYNLDTSPFRHPNELWTFADDSIMPDDKVNSAVQSSPEYAQAVATMNFHANKIKFSRGYDQPDIAYFDISIADYVNQQLNISATKHPIVYEYLMTEIFLLTGGLPETQSAMSLLYLVAGFGGLEGGGVQKTFHLSRKWHRVNGGMSRLIDKLLAEFESLGGVVRYNQPVIEVSAIPKPRVEKTTKCSGVLPVYDYPEGTEALSLIQFKLASGQLLLSRGAVIAVPLSCLSSIRFSPPLPASLRDASERCQAGVQLVKLWGRAVSVSPRVFRTLTYCHACKDIRHSEYQLDEEEENSLMALTLDARGEPLDVDEKLFSVFISGWRRDLLTRASNTGTGGNSSSSIGGSRVGTSNSTLTVGSSSSGSTLASSDPLAALAPSDALMRTIHPKAEFVQTAGATLHYHDFNRDPFSHSSWFCLRAGAAFLHARAVADSVQPWCIVSETAATVDNDEYTSRASSNEVAAASNGSLTLACSDLCPEWTGWVEGGVIAGQRAAERMVTYLIPEKIPRNFLKRIPPPGSRSDRK